MNEPKTEQEEKKPVVYKDIHHAINEIYKRVGYVQKKGKIEINANRSYTVATEAEFIAAIRPEMEDVGIYQKPHDIQVITNERLETVKEYNGNRTIAYSFRSVIHAVYRFTHKDSNTFVDVPAIGEGQDSGDKSFYKAMTGANKYAVRQLFMIETGDDPDKYASVEHVSEVAAPKPKAFTNSALRNAFIKNAESAFEKADSLDELSILMESYKPKFDEMKASDNEYDKMGIESLRQYYVVIRKRLENPPEIPQNIQELDEAFKNKIWEP